MALGAHFRNPPPTNVRRLPGPAPPPPPPKRKIVTRPDPPPPSLQRRVAAAVHFTTRIAPKCRCKRRVGASGVWGIGHGSQMRANVTDGGWGSAFPVPVPAHPPPPPPHTHGSVRGCLGGHGFGRRGWKRVEGASADLLPSLPHFAGHFIDLGLQRLLLHRLYGRPALHSGTGAASANVLRPQKSRTVGKLGRGGGG